ncbi:TonB-dependent receptor [Gemmatimonadota bacterium]
MSKSWARLPSGMALSLLVPLLIAGCATKTFPTAEDRERPAVEVDDDGGRKDVFTARDISRTGATNAWDALDRVVKFAVFEKDSRGQPDRIRRRGSSTIHLHEDMQVFVDGVRVLDVRDLGHMPAGVIQRIEVLSGLDGTTRYGTNSGDGVILIFTRG